jgi:hypothetical protein
MELFAEVVSVVGAMLLSVSCGLLLEELLFGGLVRLFFSKSAAPSRFAPKPAGPEANRMESR